MTEIGVIFPPEQLKEIVDKTAKFVALNGEEFEYKVIQKEGKNAKFNFLKPENPYNSYYKFAVEHFLKLLKSNSPLIPPEVHTPSTVLKNRLLVQRFLSKKKKKFERKIPVSDPLPIIYNLEIPPKITPLELDIIKLTAIFIAKNGMDFLGVIAGRESRNRRFDFLKIGHKHFNYYSKLVDIYKLILHPTKQTVEKIKFFSALENKVKILDMIYSKREWVDYQNEQKKKEELEKIKEEEAQFLIDWHDFKIVETVEFEFNDLNIYDTNVYEINDDVQDENEDDHEMEIDDVETLKQEEKISERVSHFEEVEDEDEEVGDKKVVDGYVRSKKIFRTKRVQDLVKDPISGALISADKSEKHMKIQLIDPQYKINKAREMDKFKTTNIADNAQLTEHLDEFAKTRTDIFGKKELDIGEKLVNKEQQNNQKKYIWDGRSSTIPLIPPPPMGSMKNNDLELPPAPPVIHMNVDISQSLEEQIKQNAMAAALVTTKYQLEEKNKQSQVVKSHNQQNLVLQNSQRVYNNNRPFIPMNEQPPVKKKKTGKVSESEWLRRYGGELECKIEIPNVQVNPDWKLNGQTVNLKCDMGKKVYEICKQLESLIGIPITKQRLRIVGIGFLKLSKTLAFYNFSKEKKIHLVLKKKK